MVVDLKFQPQDDDLDSFKVTKEAPGWWMITVVSWDHTQIDHTWILTHSDIGFLSHGKFPKSPWLFRY